MALICRSNPSVPGKLNFGSVSGGQISKMRPTMNMRGSSATFLNWL